MIIKATPEGKKRFVRRWQVLFTLATCLSIVAYVIFSQFFWLPIAGFLIIRLFILIFMTDPYQPDDRYIETRDSALFIADRELAYASILRLGVSFGRMFVVTKGRVIDANIVQSIVGYNRTEINELIEDAKRKISELKTKNKA
jgi:hypothetical protein